MLILIYTHTVKALNQVMTNVTKVSICGLPLTWREVDEGHTLMAEPLNLLELLAAPQCNATLVEGGQVGAFGRPAHVRLCPALHQDTKKLLVCKPATTVELNLMRPPLALRFKVSSTTYCSLFSCDRILSIVIENGSPLSSFVDHTVLVTTVRVLNPMAHISLNRQTCSVSGAHSILAHYLFCWVIQHSQNL